MRGNQIRLTDKRTPLLPPNEYMFVTGRQVVEADSPETSRWLFHEYRTHYNNRNSKHCFVDGALYKKIFNECVFYIKPIPGQLINLTISLYDEAEKKEHLSDVKIYLEPNRDHEYLTKCNNLGESLKNFDGNTCRNGKYDKGSMRVVGSGKKKVVTMGYINLPTKINISNSPLQHYQEVARVT